MHGGGFLLSALKMFQNIPVEFGEKFIIYLSNLKSFILRPCEAGIAALLPFV